MTSAAAGGWGVLFPDPTDQRIDPQEDEQVEPRIDDAAAEVEVRKDGPDVGQYPKCPEQRAAKSGTDPEDHDQRDDAADRVREPCREFPDAERLHGDRLHPDEERRLLVERQVVDQGLRPVAGDEHFPRDLREVDLVPIEKMYRTKAGDEEQRRDYRDDQLDATRGRHGPKVAANAQRLPRMDHFTKPIRAKK